MVTLEAKSPKLRCCQGHTPSEVSRGGSFLASSSSGKPQAFFGLWQHNLISTSVFL